MQCPSDKEIIGLLNRGNPDDLNKGLLWIYRKYGTVMCQAIRKQLHDSRFSEDDIETVFEDILNALGSKESSQHRNLKEFFPEFEGSLGVWLATTAQNKARDRYKEWIFRNEVRPNPNHEDVESGEDFIDSIVDYNSLEDDVFSLIFYKDALSIIEQLPDDKKAVLLLKELGQTHLEIADNLNISPYASKKRLQRANEDIKAGLVKNGYGKEDDRYSIFPLWWIFRRNIQDHTYMALYNKPIDNTATKNLGDLIREKRSERSLSRYELSQKTGLERPLLAALENGRILQLDIKAEWLDAIAKSLNINPTELELQTHANKEITKSTIESRSKHKNIGRENSPPQQKRQTGKRTIRWLTMLVIVIFVYTNWSDIMDYVNDLLRTVSEQPVSATIPPSSQLSCVIEGGNPNFRDKQGKVVEGDYLMSGTEVFVIGTASIPGEGDYYLVQTEGREGLIYNTFCNVSPVDLLPEVTLIPSEVMANESSQIEATPSNDENNSQGPLNIPAAWQYKGELPRNCRFVEGDKRISLPDIIEGWYTYNIASIYITERNEEVTLYETTDENYNYVDSLGNRLTINPELGLLTTSFLGEQPSICYPPSEFLQLEVDSIESSCGKNPIVSNNITLRSTSTIYFKWQVSNSESIAFYRYQLRRLMRYSKGTFEQPGGVDPYLIPPLFEGTTTEPATSIPFEMVFEAGPNELSEFDIFELGVSIVSLDGGVFDYSKIQFGGIENLLTFKEICSLDQGEY